MNANVDGLPVVAVVWILSLLDLDHLEADTVEMMHKAFAPVRLVLIVVAVPCLVAWWIVIAGWYLPLLLGFFDSETALPHAIAFVVTLASYVAMFTTPVVAVLATVLGLFRVIATIQSKRSDAKNGQDGAGSNPSPHG